MKQAAPSKNVTPKKKRRRVQTDFSGGKAKRRKEARRLKLESLLLGTPRKQPEVDVDDVGLKSRKHRSINKLTLGSIDEGIEEDRERTELGETLPLDIVDLMADHQRKTRKVDRSRSNMNVRSWLDNNYNKDQFKIADEDTEIKNGGELTEVIGWSWKSMNVRSVL